jgi:hypothetical protein
VYPASGAVRDSSRALSRFNELRKVRNKPKAAGTERPFSRMYNFFVLEQGDKWAKTGTRFKPRNAAGYPRPECVKSSETKKERAPKSSPAMAPQWSAKSPQWSSSKSPAASTASSSRAHESAAVTPASRAQEAPKRQVSTPKMTPQAMRPLAGRNSLIMGNRASPPPPAPSMERARLDAMLNDEEPPMTSHRMQQLLGKRRRASEEMEFDLGAPQPLDLPSARRLRTVEPRSHAAYMSDSMVGYHSHSHAYPRYHHHPAASLGEDEQAYLYRMRPEVREEVMAPLLHRVRDRAHLYSPAMHSYMRETAVAARRMDMLESMHHREMESMHHREAHMSSYRSSHAVRAHDDHEEGYGWDARRGADMRTETRMVSTGPLPADEDTKSPDPVEASDGFSSTWSTPDGVQSICEDFVGSPLDLGESECLAALLDSPPAAATPGKKSAGLVFDDIEDTPWAIEDFSCGTSW